MTARKTHPAFAASLVAAREIKPVIDRRYALEQFVEAQRSVKIGYHPGKVGIPI